RGRAGVGWGLMPPLQRQSSRSRERQRRGPERSAPAPGTIGAGAQNDQRQRLGACLSKVNTLLVGRLRRQKMAVIQRKMRAQDGLLERSARVPGTCRCERATRDARDQVAAWASPLRPAINAEIAEHADTQERLRCE